MGGLTGGKYYTEIGCRQAANQERIGWDSDLVVVLLNGPATFTESELKTAWKLTETEKFHLNLTREFTKLIIQSIFRSDSVNVAGPLSKKTTKSLSQPILYSDQVAAKYRNKDVTIFLQPLWLQLCPCMTVLSSL